MNASKALGLMGLTFLLFSCEMDVPAGGYAERAEAFIRSGDRAEALEVLRKGIYRHPDSYELNMLLGRTVLAYYTDLTPHARSRYLARYYFRRAQAVAPDMRSADLALAEYERVREKQGTAR